MLTLATLSHAADTVALEVLVKLRSVAALPPILAQYPGIKALFEVFLRGRDQTEVGFTRLLVTERVDAPALDGP